MYGYVVVAAAFLVYIPVAGFINSFGVFVDKFDKDFCQPNDCLDLLGLISALALASFRLLCWLCVLLESRLPTLVIFIVGATLCVVSMLATSYVNSVSMLLVSHSLLYGVGSTFMLNSPISVIEKHFPKNHKHHVLTTSIINLGPPIGVIIMNPLSVYLESKYSHTWRDTLRIFGFLITIVSIIYIVVTCIPKSWIQANNNDYEDLDKSEDYTPTARRNAEVETLETSDENGLVELEETMTSSPFLKFPDIGALTWIGGIFFVSAAIYIPKTLFIKFMTTIGINEGNGALIMAYSGMSEAIFSFLISITGDLMSFHILLLYTCGSGVLAVANGLLPMATGSVATTFYAVVHGSVDGLLMTVLYSIISHVSREDGHKRALWSATNFMVGVGQVSGLPLAGMLYDKTRTYTATFFMSSSAFTVAFLLFLATYVRLHKDKKPPYREFDNPQTTAKTPNATVTDEKRAVLINGEIVKTYGNGKNITEGNKCEHFENGHQTGNSMPPASAEACSSACETTGPVNMVYKNSSSDTINNADRNGNMQVAADVHTRESCRFHSTTNSLRKSDSPPHMNISQSCSNPFKKNESHLSSNPFMKNESHLSSNPFKPNISQNSSNILERNEYWSSSNPFMKNETKTSSNPFKKNQPGSSKGTTSKAEQLSGTYKARNYFYSEEIRSDSEGDDEIVISMNKTVHSGSDSCPDVSSSEEDQATDRGISLSEPLQNIENRKD